MTRVKTFINGGTLLPTDLNSIQDDYETKINDARLLGGMNSIDGLTVRRGKSIIATTESRTNTAYGLLATPDRVSNITLAADGLIFIAYQAMWKSAVGVDPDTSSVNAAIFLGANQLKAAVYGTTVPAITKSEAYLSGDADKYANLATYHNGLASGKSFSGFEYTGDVATGQVISSPEFDAPTAQPNASFNGRGGLCAIFIAAGTYDVSVQFKAASGAVTVKNRKLWVWTENF